MTNIRCSVSNKTRTDPDDDNESRRRIRSIYQEAAGTNRCIQLSTWDCVIFSNHRKVVLEESGVAREGEILVLDEIRLLYAPIEKR